MSIQGDLIMRKSRSRFRAALLLTTALVAALGVATVVPRGGGQPASTAAASTGDCVTDGSAACFQLASLLGDGNLGVGSNPDGTFEHARVQGSQSAAGTIQWAAVMSADKTYVTLRNLASAGKCLTATTDVNDGYLTDCASATKFRLSMNSDANVGRFVSVDKVGYCLHDHGAQRVPGTTGPTSVDLMKCGNGDGETFALSGPTSATDPNRNWARKLALGLEFARCNSEPSACVFTPDNPNVEPVLQTQPAGCLRTWHNTSETSTATYSVAYTTTKQSARRLGNTAEATVGVEAMWEGNGVTMTFGTNAYQSHTYTHVDTDASSYSITVPPKMFGWMADTEYVDVQPGTYTFDEGTSYEWSDHRSIYGFADLAPDHPLGHRVIAAVGLNLPADCKDTDPVVLSSTYDQADRSGQLLSAFPYAIPANPASKDAQVGFAFTTGAKSIRVTDLGRVHLPSSRLDGSPVATCGTCTRDHLVQLVQIDSSGNMVKLLLYTWIDERGVAADAPAQPIWGDSYFTSSGAACAATCPVVLKPNTEYALMSTEGYGDNFGPAKLTADPAAGVTLLGPVMWGSDGFKSNTSASLTEWGGATLEFSTS